MSDTKAPHKENEVGVVVEHKTEGSTSYSGVLYASAILSDKVPPGAKLYVAAPTVYQRPTGLSRGWNLVRQCDGFVIGHGSDEPSQKHKDQALADGRVYVPFLVQQANPAPAIARCDTCNGQGEVWTGENQSFAYMSMQPPEPIMEDCPECGGDTVKPDHSADNLNMVSVPRDIAERMAADAAQYDHEHAIVNDNVQLWQQPNARLSLTVGDLRAVRELLAGGDQS